MKIEIKQDWTEKDQINFEAQLEVYYTQTKNKVNEYVR